MRRVVVTGMGALTPLGSNVSDTWKSALEGRSGVSQITLFDSKDSPVTIAGEVKGFDPCLVTNSKEARKVGRFCNLALAAGQEAFKHSGLDQCRAQISPSRMGVNIGVGMGGLPEIQVVHKEFLEKGYRRVTPFFIPQAIPNLASGQLSILLGLQGPNLCNVTACASSSHSIGESFRLIKRGEADVMIAGGAEAVICELAIAGFASMRALSTRNETPEKASRPFDRDRDGFVMGEGAAILVLEEYEMARKRGAEIFGEILGYGLSGDAYHITAPAPEGAGGRRAMELALRDAELRPEQIGYINAHGTSTPSGDIEEVRAITQVFPQGRNHLHISSTKSMTGHLLGAAGALEALFSLLAIRDGKIPPTINLENPDPACVETGISFTPNHSVEKKIQYALSNSFGFGGTNASLVLGRVR